MAIHGLTRGVKRIDHVAIVVRELEMALRLLSRHAGHRAVARHRLSA